MGMLGADGRGYGVDSCVPDKLGNKGPLLSEWTGLGNVVGVPPYLTTQD